MNGADVVIIGAGAAGLAAGHRLKSAGIGALVVEARRRRGGRAWTVTDLAPYPIDLGCHWLHSGDRNPWTAIAEGIGLTIDRSPAPWNTRPLDVGGSRAALAEFEARYEAFNTALHERAAGGDDSAASDLLVPGDRWNGQLNAVSCYVNGAELDRISIVDVARYDDSGVNWRVRQGLGAAILAFGAKVPVALETMAQRIDHRGKFVRIETTRGTLVAKAVVVTLPTSLLAAGTLRFDPPLPDKVEAAAGLPLGVADKVTLVMADPGILPEDSHVLGRTDRVATGSYHVRPLGHPVIEGFFGGALARELEAGGPDAFAAFAVDELAGLLGEGVRRQLSLVVASAWQSDPFARGSYSHALPGFADRRSDLARPVDDRLYFAGEACSVSDYSTAHGAYRTGADAADTIIARRYALGV